jgi:hypothetical protein
MTRIHVVTGERILPATLDDTPAARDFAALLPLELTLSDFHGIEKVADLPRPLDAEGAPSAYAASAGDIAYYAPWGNLAFFYEPFRRAAGLVRLGRFDGGLEPLLQAGEIRVRIEAAGSS